MSRYRFKVRSRLMILIMLLYISQYRFKLYVIMHKVIVICLWSWWLCFIRRYAKVTTCLRLQIAHTRSFWQDRPKDASKDSFLMHRTYYDINVFKSAGYPFTNVFLPKLDCCRDISLPNMFIFAYYYNASSGTCGISSHGWQRPGRSEPDRKCQQITTLLQLILH